MRKIFILAALITLISFESSSQSRAVFYTTQGNFTLYLEDTLSPITVGNFISLVNQKYYDGVLFHRVIKNFMIQGGNGGAKPSIQDEFITGLSNVKGTISMANTGRPNSGSTQFFINLKNNSGLDWNKSPLSSKHPVFGHIEYGFNLVERIGSVKTSGRPLDKPIVDVVIDSIRILRKIPTPQNLEVQNVFFTNPSGLPSNPINSQELVAGRSLKLWFNFKNSLAISQNLKTGDSLTFGWAIDGKDQGTLTMSSLNNDVINGASLDAFLKSNYVVSKTVGQVFEICTWPLYNPYYANTDALKGRHCTSFKTIDIPSSVQFSEKDKHNIYVVNRKLIFDFEDNIDNNNVEIYNFNGGLVQVGNTSEAVLLNSSLTSGFYIVRVNMADQILIKKIFID